MAKFKAGDRVYVDGLTDRKGTVHCEDHHGYLCVDRDDGVRGGSHGERWFANSATDLIEATPIHKATDTMSKLVDFFKDLGATPEEKLLKKHGIEDPIGTPTDEGLKLMARILYKENRAKVIELAKQMDEAEKAEAKK